MSLRIQNNVEAFGAHRNLQSTSGAISKSMERLSSGYRINRGADDAAGLGISEKMRGQIKGLAQAQRNIGDGVSMVQTAEANLDEVHSMLQRVRELAVQYNNSTNSAANQSAIQSEVYQLASEIERIGSSAQFNGISLLNTTGSVTFQVGANDGQVITVALISLGSTVGGGVSTWYSLGTSTAISQIDAAIDGVSAARATFGAVQNRLEHANAASAAYQENLVAAESRIRDVDMAEEMINFTKNQVLSQAGQSMLSQANQSSQGVLSLLR
ncbi:flagellin N-terminal helical domain-containing protein [Capillimicrobium parvum]|uniref:Flagellin n=1 Tax=Capillimicrobium parvum TaxID=2884022 RepID=A0A9E6XS24_9ACTN|nr:flagellin [Capillimicrobium parvum]UGS33753.1 Flagellin [Capillimicrobium parvum]